MTLPDFIHRHNLDPVAAMNNLQDNGIISDLYVSPEDVRDDDVLRAIVWLRQEMRTGRLSKGKNQ